MKKVLVILTLIFAVNIAFAFAEGEPLEFKAKVGFIQSEDKIVEHKFLDGGKKLLIIGRKNLQVWDVETAKLINSAPHKIAQFAPKGFVSNYLLLGLPEILSWRSYVVEPSGKWIVTIEKTGDDKPKVAIVRDLQTVKQIATLELPNNISVDYITFDERKNEIVTFGQTDNNAAFANWDVENFKLKRVIPIEFYKWHQFIRGEEKMIVGAGDTKMAWTVATGKQGATLSLRDVKTGAIEKEFTAPNLEPKTTYLHATVSADEKYLMAKRNDRIIVWEIAGNGAPKYEIAKSDPKENFDFVRVIGGKIIVVAVGEKLRFYEFGGSGAPKFELAAEKAGDTVEVLTATNDGRFFVVGEDTKISVFETAGGGKPLYEIRKDSEKERFSTVNFTDVGNYLVVGRTNRSEKKPERTEFYDVESGKLAFDIPMVVSSDMRFTRDRKFLLTELLGATSVWNFSEKRAFHIPLEVDQPSMTTDSLQYGTTTAEPYNSEYTALSPNEKFILRYGEKIVSVFDIETGKEVQVIFDPQKVKYDKQNKIKKSGYTEAGWTEDGKYLYAFSQSGFFYEYDTISLWRVSK